MIDYNLIRHFSFAQDEPHLARPFRAEAVAAVIRANQIMLGSYGLFYILLRIFHAYYLAIT